jgi:hypothetical protein
MTIFKDPAKIGSDIPVDDFAKSLKITSPYPLIITNWRILLTVHNVHDIL